jgi:DHA1 family putative efflux transporter-like MFS transporter
MPIFLLALGAFLTGTAEMIVGGILTPIADDLHVSIAAAGQLITAFSLAFAIGTPIVVAMTYRIARKKVLLGSLVIFIIGSFVSFTSTEYSVMLVSRLILGLSTGVYTVVAFSSVAKIVPASQMGRAVGTVALGISSAMVLGVPLGIAITKWWSWQIVFAVLGIASLLVWLIVLRLLPEIEGDARVTFKQQFAILGNPILLSGLFFSFLFSTSCSMIFAYVTPFLQTILHLKLSEVGVAMLAIGVSGVIGSRLGGIGVDKWGTIRIILFGLAIFAFILAIIPVLILSPFVVIALFCLWVCVMSIVIPAIQTYFIQVAPQSSNLVLGLNTSILHLGVAVGAGIGGLAVETSSTVLYNPSIASITTLLCLAAASLSFALRKRNRRLSSAMD